MTIANNMDTSLRDAFKQVRFRCNEDKFPEVFFIVTACNPDGVTVSDKDNAIADKALHEAIAAAGFPAFRVTGGNFNFSHAEPGWGIICNRDDAKAFAASFRQLAFFEIREGQLFLVPTDPSDGRVEDLGELALRLNDGEPD